MTIPTEVLLWALGGICAIIGALILAVVSLFKGDMKKLGAELRELKEFVMGPETKLISYGKCQLEMVRLEENISKERQERKDEDRAIGKRLDDHIEATAT